MLRFLEKEELQLRWNKVQRALIAEQTDAALITGIVNLYYLTGRVFNGYCYIPQEGSPLFFVKKPLDLMGEGVHYIRKPEEIPSLIPLTTHPHPQSLAVEIDQSSYAEVERLKAAFAPQRVSNGSLLMRNVRSIKTPFEVQIMRQMGATHVTTQRKVAQYIHEGMTDLQLAHQLNALFLASGSVGLFRMYGANMEMALGGSTLVGDNALNASPYDFALGGAGTSPCLPIGCDGRRISKGNSIMIDIGGSFSAYMTDMTRVYSIGTLPDIALRAHDLSIRMHRYAQGEARPGTACADLYTTCLEWANSEGLADYFMGFGQQAAFVGHGVGMEVNELPVMFRHSKALLEENLIFAFEPKFVLPGIGAVGVENTYVVTPTGADNITPMEEEIIVL